MKGKIKKIKLRRSRPLQLRSVKYQKNPSVSGYPFDLPIFQTLDELTFEKPVTILVGDNGTGKSTILESIATAGELITIGNDLKPPAFGKDITQSIKLIWNMKSRIGFYFKANDFIQFIERTKEAKRDSRAAIEEIERSNLDPMAKMPHARTLYDLKQLYGEGLEFRSHGESFLDLFQSRFKPNGLYILDEPEAPLSPINQLALISLMKEAIEEGAQFIIATHSPILMAFPEAEIYSLEVDSISTVAYDELEHVTLTRDFLNNPGSFLRHL